MIKTNPICIAITTLIAFWSANLPLPNQKTSASTHKNLSATLRTVNPDNNAVAIDDYIRGIPQLSMVPAAAPHMTAQGAQQNLGIVERRRKLCQTSTYSQTTAFEEIAALDPNTASIYPSALVQGATLLSGRFTEIALPRGATTLTVTGLAVSGPNVVLSANVPEPSLASVQAAVNTIVADPSHIAPNSLARMSLQISQVHSFEQALLDAGVSASWLSGDFSARLKTITTSKKNSLIVKFNQVYYEVNAKGLALPSEAFAPAVTVDQIKMVAFPSDPQIPHPLNPPLMVKTVKYGRMAILAIASDATATDLETAVRASFNAVSSSGQFTMDQQSRQILEHSTFDGVVVGGSGNAGAALLSSVGAGNLTALGTFLTTGATYHPQNSPGAPISYVLTYLDNQVADSSFSADFSLTGCEFRPVPIEKLRIGWSVGDDNKDQEMYPYVIVRDKNGRIVSNSGGEGRIWASIVIAIFGPPRRFNAAWNENVTFGPFEVPIIGQWNLDQCTSATAEVGQRSSNGEDPEWHTTFFIDVRIDGRWFTIRAPSQNTNEFKWGDGKPDSALTGLACPAL